MWNKPLLTRFFVTSYYSKPKQILSKVVLIIALIYLFLQITVLNAMIYFLGHMEVYMFYNLVISNVLVYVLVSYLSVSAVFHHREFMILGTLPITPEKIVLSKISSSLFVPAILLIIIQMPTLLFLLISMEWVNIIKLLLFLPVSNLFTALVLLFVLSIVNVFRSFIKAKVIYLFINIGITLLLPSVFLFYVIKQTGGQLLDAFSVVNLSTLETFIDSLTMLLSQLNELFLAIPGISPFIGTFSQNDFSVLFFVIVLSMTVLSFLLFMVTVKLISRNYSKQGLLEGARNEIRKSKVYSIKSEWAAYIQREVWIIQTEAYFKLQFTLTLCLTPILSLLFLWLLQTDLIPFENNIVKTNHFEKYFLYATLCLSCVNNTSGTPYSREGNYHYLTNCLPINQRKTYFSKVFLATLTSMSAVGISFILYASFGFLNTESVLIMGIVLLLVLCYNLVVPFYDQRNPLVDWVNPSEAVKSNPNVLVSLLTALPALLVIIIIHFILAWMGLESLIAAVITLIITLCLTVGMLIWLKKNRFLGKR